MSCPLCIVSGPTRPRPRLQLTVSPRGASRDRQNAAVFRGHVRLIVTVRTALAVPAPAWLRITGGPPRVILGFARGVAGKDCDLCCWARSRFSVRNMTGSRSPRPTPELPVLSSISSLQSLDHRHQAQGPGENPGTRALHERPSSVSPIRLRANTAPNTKSPFVFPRWLTPLEAPSAVREPGEPLAAG